MVEVVERLTEFSLTRRVGQQPDVDETAPEEVCQALADPTGLQVALQNRENPDESRRIGLAQRSWGQGWFVHRLMAAPLTGEGAGQPDGEWIADGRPNRPVLAAAGRAAQALAA